MPLERLTLVNFQKHRRLELRLSPGVNVLTGETEAGKSAVTRALRWLCLNQPGGDGFVRRGEPAAEVALVADGREVCRRKGKGVNLYSLDGAEYTAFGQSVPDAVAALLNVGDVNFQRQHDPLFWLALTPGEAARRLNEIVSLEAIDRATAEAASRVRKAKEKLEAAQGQLEQNERELQDAGWVKDAWRDWQRLEELEKERDGAALGRDRRESLIRNIEEAQELAQGHAGAHEEAQGWISLGDRLASLQRERDAVRTLLARIESQQKAVAAAQMDRAEAEDAFERDFKNCPLCGHRWKKPG